MKSRITIEVDFDNGNMPMIQISARTSDDVRDSLIQSFLQSLQHTSRWCTIEYKGTYGEGSIIKSEPFEMTDRWLIKPMTLDQIPDEVKLMQSALK